MAKLRMLTATFAGSLFVLTAPSSIADPAGDLSRCKAIKTASARLQCYDAINTPIDKPPAGQAYRNIDVVDLQIDYQKLVGQKIEVAGDGMMIMGVLQVSKNRASSEPIHVIISKAPREDQKTVMSRCGLYCSVVVRGTVGGNFNGLPAVTADSIEIR